MRKTVIALLGVAALMGILLGGFAEANWFFTPVNATSFDDVQINVPVSMGQSSAVVTGFAFQDRIGYYQAGLASVGSEADYYQSGADADFAVLKMDITNAEAIAVNYLENCEVKVSDGVNTYGGWAFQQNYANASLMGIAYGLDSGMQNVNWVINASDNFPLQPNEQGHYIFGCTLPNDVVKGTNPLKMTVSVKGYEFIYHIPGADNALQPQVTGLPSLVTQQPTAGFATQQPQTQVYQETKPQYVYAKDGDSNVRTGPGLGYTSLGVLKKGDSANYLNSSSEDNRGVTWYKIEYKGKDAWVSSRYTVLRDGSWGGATAKPTSAPTSAPRTSYVEGTSGKSHIRTGPALSYDDVGVLHVGETATYLGEQSTDDRGVVWYKISYKGEERWVSSKYTTLH